LAVIDGAKRTKISEARLPAHPEGFQLDPTMGRAYVNVPNARGIAVADLTSSKVIAVWPVGGASANFPMAVDNDSNRVLVVFRQNLVCSISAMVQSSGWPTHAAMPTTSLLMRNGIVSM